MPNIELDLPLPLSVNSTRRVNWASIPKQRAWTKNADALTLAAWAGGKRPTMIVGKFEAQIIVSKDSRLDLDNGIKKLLDYARYLGLIVDDGPKYMRRMYFGPSSTIRPR